MSLIPNVRLSLEDALGLLSTRTMSPSTLGAQIERMQERAELGPMPPDYNGIKPKPSTPDAVKAQADAENRMLRDAGVIRCLDAFACVERFKGAENLKRVQRAVKAPQGAIATQCLRVYEPWRLLSQERALAAVYAWASVLLPDMFPPVKHDDLAQGFREGKSTKARTKAADLYADCYLALAEHVVLWNRKQIKRVA